ncbi:MgtC/SapB family protein [Paracoccus sp. p4-l81]
MPFATAILRLIAAALMGSLIGWEREVNARPAGLRTHMLVSLASALFALLALELTYLGDEAGVRLTSDPLRMIEAVTSGVAFLAAGSIITSGGKVKGLTTGASMWMAGAVGLACGIGKLQLALVAMVFALIVLWIVRRLMPDITPDRNADQD